MLQNASKAHNLFITTVPPLVYYLRFGGRFNHNTLKRHVAGTHHTCQGQSTYTNQHVCGLYQPVQIPGENIELRQTKDWYQQCVHYANNAPDPQISGADRYNTHDQQSKGYDQAKEHMNADQVNVSDPDE